MSLLSLLRDEGIRTRKLAILVGAKIGQLVKNRWMSRIKSQPRSRQNFFLDIPFDRAH